MAEAIAFAGYGGPEVLQPIEVGDEHPAAGEVRVRVEAAGVQPFDCALRRGALAEWIPVTFPCRLGNEFAGVVDEVGAGVTGVRVGSEVLGWVMMAGYAEAVVVGADQVVDKPPAMSWEAAGVLSASGQTAHTALDELGVGSGDTVLIHAAAGGVGTFAVQLARARGATVIGTASERNHDYLGALGAIPVSYGIGLEERVRAAAPGGVTAALDAIGGDALYVSTRLVADRTRIGTIADRGAAASLGVRAIGTVRSTSRLTELVELHSGGRLRVTIQASYPLRDAPAAHRDIETGHVRGKIVLATG